VVDSIFFFGHAVPGEIHLFPGGAVSNTHVEAVMTF